MVLLFLKKYIKEIIAIAVISLFFYSFYSYSYQKGYDNRVAYYEEVRKKEFLTLNSKIDKIENLSTELSDSVKKNQNGLEKDLNQITGNVKNIKSYILKNGECVPSEEFLNSFNSIILRGNK